MEAPIKQWIPIGNTSNGSVDLVCSNLSASNHLNSVYSGALEYSIHEKKKKRSSFGFSVYNGVASM
jgi:hypothetical protein